LGLSFDHFEPTLGDEKKRKEKKRKEEGCKVYVTYEIIHLPKGITRLPLLSSL
jgi:hypothetical protein